MMPKFGLAVPDKSPCQILRRLCVSAQVLTPLDFVYKPHLSIILHIQDATVPPGRLLSPYSKIQARYYIYSKASEVGKVTLKSNGDEALSDESL